MILTKSAVIFIGIPGSGKSTFYNKYFAGRYVHINLDTLHTRKKEKQLLHQCLMNGQSFVVDNTNPTAADRQRYIAPAKAAEFSVTGYYFRSTVSDCIARNELREGKARVPVKAIKAISSKRELPSLDEGFDLLFVVTIENGEYGIKEWSSGGADVPAFNKSSLLQ